MTQANPYGQFRMTPFEPPENTDSLCDTKKDFYTWLLQFLTDSLNDVAELNIECYIAAMTNGNETDRILAEAADKIRREAYAAGWRDAIAAMNKAAAELVDPQTREDLEIREAVEASATIVSRTPMGPTVGSTPWYVLQAVRKQPGMTGSEVVGVVRESGHKVSEGSIRTSLARLGEKKAIVSRHRKWFPA